MKKIITAAIFSLVLLFGAIAAQAATLTVTKIADTNDNVCDADCSLREAIFAAASGDTIEFAPSVFNSAQTNTLSLGELAIDKTLTVNGKGASLTALSGNNASRVFRLAPSGNLTLNNLTVTGGRDGGNGNKYGGGIFNAGTLTINNAVFSGNVVSGNNISYGGAIYNDDNSTMTITGSSISGNSNTGFATNVNCRGSGIYNAANTTVNITNSSISNNTGNTIRDNAGIGIYHQGGTMTITGSTISGNTVSNPGANTNHAGGIYNSGTIMLINSTISGNTAISGNFSNGGGIYNLGTLTMINSTVTRNTASSTFSTGGGGISNLYGTINAVNTIISGNTSPNSADLQGGLAVNTNNYIGGDAKLALLGANGGATQTHALLSDSPALNAGNVCVLTADACGFTHPSLTTDQRGANFPRSFGTAVDIGAVEDSIIISPTTLTPGTKNVAYSQTLTATGNSSPYTFTLDSGTLPTGYTLSSGGLLSGTTAQEGTFNFAVRVTGANGFFIIRNYVLLIGYYVTNANNSGAGSLRQIVADVPAGSTIRFDPVFFSTPRTIPGGAIDIFKNLTIIGPGANLLTLDGQNTSRVLNIDNIAGTLTLSGIRIARGNSGAGSSAGCILITNGTLNANSIAVDSCSTPNFGGGIYNNGTLILNNSTVNVNTAGFAGGIYNVCARTVTITSSIISNNTSTGGAGGIGNCGTLNVLGSTFNGNSATFGGALTAGTTSIINNSTISGNTATTNKAGAVYIGNTDRLDTTNTTITNNVSNGNLTGGIYSDGGAYNTRNSIIAGNRNGNGSGAQDIAGSITSFGYNLIGSTAGNSFAAGSPNLTGNLTNVSANLAPLANFGGTVQTHVLLSNSPAINAGDPNNSFTTDQRGSLRPIGGRGDIGSFERNITFDQSTLPNGNLNTAYNQTLTVTRLTNFAENLFKESEPFNFAPFTFAVIPVSGQSLPNGLTLSTGGQISGTATASGSFTFTVRATDADGMAGAAQYTIVIINTPPTISGATISRQSGSSVSNSTIATVNDLESGANGVSVAVTSANPSNGVTVSTIVNTNGTITANAVAACGATNANFTLTATDGGGATATATLNVTITANTAPTLVYPASFNVNSGGSLNVAPTTATDNGSISYSIQSVSPVLTTAPTINSSGVVSITNANPVGNHTITVRATDNCGLITDTSFTLNVTPPVRTVTKTDDTNDGVCDGDCSLREAIAAANSGDTIQFAAPLFNSAQTITLTSELSVTGKIITITGKGANLTNISGNNLTRVFNVGSGGNLTLDGLTVTNGRDFSAGGGIYNGAALTIINSAVSNSSVSGGSDNFGGGVYNASQATLTIRNSTISGNSVTGSSNFSNRGGGIANVNGTLVITNSTVSGNSLGGGTNNRGGGIYSEFGTLTIINETITGNFIGSGSFNFGGGLATLNDTVNLGNTIIAGNSAAQNPDLLGSLNTSDHNFIGGDARLAPLGFYGGATQTHALLSDSPALNSGNNCVLTANGCANGNPALTADQRGSQRLIGEVVDIGAFERNITFNQSTVPSGRIGQPYNNGTPFQLSAQRQNSGAEFGAAQTNTFENFAPAQFAIVAGQLPPGITLSTGGQLSGTPTGIGGTYAFTIKATDTDGIAGVQQFVMMIFVPTAANVTVSGRILTAEGSGVRNARVILTDSSGNSRTVLTGTFGYYSFDGVSAGETYIVSVVSKHFIFAPQVISVVDEVIDLNFTAIE